MKCLLTEFVRARREDIWHSAMALGRRCAQSVRYDLDPNIFRPALPLSQ